MSPTRTPHRPTSPLRGRPDMPAPRTNARRRTAVEGKPLPSAGLRAEVAAQEPAVSGTPSARGPGAPESAPRPRNQRIEQLIERLGVRKTIEQHPYALIGGAFSLGYVLGGGRITTVVLRVGGQVVQRELKRLSSSLMAGLQGV